MKYALLGVLLAGASSAATNPLLSPAPSTATIAGTPSYIWLTDGMQKIRQDSTTGPNAIGPNQGLTIYCNRNEYCPVQVHVQAPAGGIPDLGAFLSSMTLSVAPFTTITTATFTPDILNAQEFYQTMSTPSSQGGAYMNAAGVYPFTLMPFTDPYFGQTTAAGHANVAAGNNQSFWINLKPSSSTPDGWYYGTVAVSSAGVTIAQLRVSMGVWAFIMPSTATYRTVTGTTFGGLCLQYGSPAGNREGGCGAGAWTGSSSGVGGGPDDLGNTIQEAFTAQFFLDHRISASSLYPGADSNFVNLETYTGPLLNGTSGLFHQFLPGAKLNTSQYVPGTFSPTTAGNWMTEFANKSYSQSGNSAMPYEKDCDENGCTSAQFIVKASSMHAANPPMSTAWTTSLAYNSGTNATNYLDIAVVLNTNLDPNPGPLATPQYNTWLASNLNNCGPSNNLSCPAHQLWHYDDCVSEGGNCSNGTVGGVTGTWANKHADGYAAANRMEPWIAYGRDSAVGELYFSANICMDPPNQSPWCNTGSYPGLGHGNPYTSIYYSGGQADGTQVMPAFSSASWQTAGYTVTFAVATATPSWNPTMTLEQWTDGIQDYDALKALEHLSGSTAAGIAIAQGLVTNAFTFNVSTFSTGGYTQSVASARLAVGQSIQAYMYPAVAASAGTVFMH